MSDSVGHSQGLAQVGTGRTQEPPLLLSGLDSLYVCYYLDAHTGGLDWDRLAYEKERLKVTREELVELELGSERLALLPYGRHPYRYVLSCCDFEVRLAERLQPCCQIQFSSQGLWKHGKDALTARVAAWFRSLGIVATQPEVVSRADWAFDYHLPVVDFDLDSFVSRATKDGQNREHGAVQTYRFGQGATVVRVYDKVAEIEQQSGKAVFYELWGQTENVWRIEFQLRSERLKQGGIRTLADLDEFQGDVLREVASQHTTLREKTSDPNRSRWPLHPLWRRLQADIARLPETGLIREIDPAVELDWRLHRQLRSLYGSLKGLAAIRSLLEAQDKAMPLETLLAELPDLLRDEHAESIWLSDVNDRITKHGYGQW